MIFIEASFFAEDVKQLLSDEEYGKLQEHLAAKQKAVLRKINEGWKN